MMTRLVYLVGVPGSGKTTALRSAFDLLGVRRHPGRAWTGFDLEYLATDAAGIIGVHLGRDRPPYGGTDALSMSVQPRVLKWLTDPGAPVPLVVGEGDRLGGLKFLDAAAALPGVRVTTVLLDTPHEEAAVRRAKRAEEANGTTPSATWLAGRLTKVENLRPRAAFILDGTRPPAVTASDLATILDPEYRP